MEPETTEAPRAAAIEDQDPPRNLLERIPWWTAPAILLGVPLLAYIVSLAYPPFYYHIVWQYYWGPIVADAAVGTHEVTRGGVTASAGYNVVNTVSWMGLLAVVLLGVAQLLHAFRDRVDGRIIIGGSVWVVAGSVFHVMQDAKLFEGRIEYLFITPPIYLMFAGFGVLAYLGGQYVAYVERRAGVHAAYNKLWFLMALAILLHTLLWAVEWDPITHYPSPLWTVAGAVVAFAVVRWHTGKKGAIDPAAMVGILAIPAILLSFVYLVTFLQGQWTGYDGRGPGVNALPSAWALATGGAGAICLALYAFFRNRTSELAAAFRKPVNLLIVFAHALDGLSTAIGIDLIRTYQEKHIVSEAIRATFERIAGAIGWEWGATHPTFLAFFPIKVALGILVVYGIDVASKEDAKRYPALIGLVKLAVIMVGLGPGVRNMVRMSLGI